MKQAVKITDNIYWVGALDFELADFHGYKLRNGSTYNAYLIVDGADSILIDTVKAPFFNEMMERISSVIEPKKIRYIISNHTEMDHTGALPFTVKALEPEAVYASTFGVKSLAAHFDLGLTVTPVKTGDTLKLGNSEFSFIETRMLHWPDSMFSYYKNEEILFSADAFGMHLASEERFCDELDAKLVHNEARSYYANILLPFSQLVTDLLASVAALDLPVKMIAPDHGPVWRGENINTPMKNYSEWASQKRNKTAIIAYDTMWESTAKLAEEAARGVKESGAHAHVMPMNVMWRSDIVTEMLDAGALIIGSPTLNNNMLPRIADLLTYIKGLKPKGLIGGSFGSFGWSGEAVGQVSEMLKNMNIEVIGECKAKFIPDEEALTAAYGLGKNIGEKLVS